MTLEAKLRNNRERLQEFNDRRILEYIGLQSFTSVAANEIATRFDEILRDIASLKEGEDIDSADRLRIAAMKTLIKKLQEYPVNPITLIPDQHKPLYAQAQLENMREKYPVYH